MLDNPFQPPQELARERPQPYRPDPEVKKTSLAESLSAMFVAIACLSALAGLMFVPAALHQQGWQPWARLELFAEALALLAVLLALMGWLLRRLVPTD